LFLLWNFFLQHRLHNPDLGSLSIVRVRREVEQLGILPRACGVGVGVGVCACSRLMPKNKMIAATAA